MGTPPAKKQKRFIVLNSDEESTGEWLKSTNGFSHGTGVRSMKGENESISRSTTTAIPARTRPKSTPVVQKPRPASSRDPTPALSPEYPNPTASKTAKSGTLYTFFNSATQTQRVTSTPRTEGFSACIEEEDSIQDEEQNDEHVSPSISQPDTRITSRQSKRFRKDNPESPGHQGNKLDGSQKFKPSAPRIRSVTPSAGLISTEGRRPWADMFEPSSIEELAVHKRKVADVKGWLDNVVNGLECKRLLILKGPSGSGKTATVSAVAKSLNLEIVEWKNPAGPDFTGDGFRSLSAQFEEFLERSGKFSGLTLQKSNGKRTEQQFPHGLVHLPADTQATRKRAILVEEFPNTFSRTSSALISFRSNILQYLVATMPSFGSLFTRKQDAQSDVTPLIMIISETLLTTTTAATDSFTAHRLFGSDILNHPGTTVIEFNPIAPTILIKALDLVIQKEARLSGRRRTPGPAVLKKLAEVGDIRSAVGSLEFMCIRGDNGSSWGGRVATKGKKGAKDTSDLTKMEEDSIEMVTQRESSLGIFHAVGKVVYNKRVEFSTANPHIEPPGQPPDHLSHHFRRYQSTVNVDELMNETGTDTATFLAGLHENYVLSCDNSTSTESLNGCIDALSDSDVLGSNRRGGFSMREWSGNQIYQGSDAESLRQNEICFQVAVRGMLFALPHPVQRRVASSQAGGRGSSKGDAFKMFYPMSMRLWKQAEEIEGLIDQWIDLSTFSLGSQASTDTSSIRGVEMWKQKSPATNTMPPPHPEPGDQRVISLVVGVSLARTEMILERLPYVAKIEHRLPVSPRKLELERMTQFDGISAPADDVPNEEEYDAATKTAVTEWDTDQSARSKLGDSVFKRSILTTAVTKKNHSFNSAILVGKEIEKLVLSDDDIEDD